MGRDGSGDGVMRSWLQMKTDDAVVCAISGETMETEDIHRGSRCGEEKSMRASVVLHRTLLLPLALACGRFNMLIYLIFILVMELFLQIAGYIPA